jgi:catalase (peroxidase I)
MLTTDLALKVDPIYGPIAKRFHENPDQLAEAFAKAWFKLLHRDLGPLSRYLGPWVPESQLWQDPVPEVDHELVSDEDIAVLKGKILASGLSPGWSPPRGPRLQVSAVPTSVAGPTGADSPYAAKGLGGQRSG